MLIRSLILKQRASLIDHMGKSPPRFNSWVRKIPWRRDRLPTPVFLGFPCGSAGKESACNAGDLGLIPGLGSSPGERKVVPLQYSGLENFMDCIVQGVAKSQTQLSDLHFTLLSRTRTRCCTSKCMCGLSCVSHVRLFETLWTVACQAPLSMGFSR